MAATEPSKGLINSAGDDDDDQDKSQFWEIIQSHYLENPDDDLLVDIIEKGQFNQHLRLKACENIRAALRKHVIALAKLRTPAAGLQLPVEPYFDYIN